MTDEKADTIPVHSTTPIDDGLENALLVAQVAVDFRGRDTIVLDMRPITPIVDFFVITTATNSRQMRAMADEVERVAKQHGLRRLGTEGGEGDSIWTLHDFGEVVLHAFSAEGRKLYDLESLWADAPRVFQQPSDAPEDEHPVEPAEADASLDDET